MSHRTLLRSAVCLPLFALLAVGCGVFGSNDAEEVPPPATNEPPLPAGAPDATHGTPTNDEVTEAFGFFVAPNGSDQSPGSRRSPFATISAAIAAAKPKAMRVYVCAGSYAESLELVNAVSVIGGYDCSQPNAWKRAAGARSSVVGTKSPAVVAKDVVDTTRFEGFDVKAPDALEPSGSSIALRAERAAKLVVADASITAGRGADGEAGTAPPPPDGGPTVNGADGLDGVGPYNAAPSAIGIRPLVVLGTPQGGTSSCGGGKGGYGGVGGVWLCQFSGVALRNVLVPVTTNGSKVVPSASSPSVIPPKVGDPGFDGTSASRPGTLTAAGFVPSDGSVGGDGGGGAGGSGGQEMPVPSDTCNYPDKYVTFSNGAGGGAGGCGGRAATAGRGGGASVGAFVVDSNGLTFEGSSITGGTGGSGGGGSFGSDPSNGGVAGKMGLLAGSGAAGSPGGRAGVSGHGAGGSSFGIAFRGAAPTLASSVAKAGAPGPGVAEKTKVVEPANQTARIGASAAGEAKDVASF